MSDAVRIAGGIALGTLLAALPFVHYRWGHAEHTHTPANVIGGHDHATHAVGACATHSGQRATAATVSAAPLLVSAAAASTGTESASTGAPRAIEPAK